MTDMRKLTLRTLFLDQCPMAARKPEQEAGAQFGDLRARVEQIPSLRWLDVQEDLYQGIGDALDIGLSDVLLGGWVKYRELQKYHDATQYPPEKNFEVPLSTHSIASTHKPYVEIRLGDKVLDRLTFEVDLRLKLNTALLTIRGGKIVEIGPGSGWAKGSVRLGPKQLFGMKTRKLELPGKIDFPEGFSIPA